MDDLSEKQMKHIRELCDVKGLPPQSEPLQRLAVVGLTVVGMMMDQMLADRAAAAAAKGKPK